MNDDFLGQAWAENHRLLAGDIEKLASLIMRRLKRAPASTARGERPAGG